MREDELSAKQLIAIISLCLLFIFATTLLSCCGNINEEEQQTKVEIESQTIPLEQESKEDTKKTKKEIKKSNKKSNEEVAEDVINGLYGNGKERIKRLKKEGYDVTTIQKIVDSYFVEAIQETPQEETTYTENTYEENTGEAYSYSGEALNPYNGVVYYGGHKETYYSQNVLPGGGLNIPGRHVAEDGTVRDGDGYICVAADPSYLEYGAIVQTSLGTGRVYDSGCDYGTIDIYTAW